MSKLKKRLVRSDPGWANYNALDPIGKSVWEYVNFSVSVIHSLVTTLFRPLTIVLLPKAAPIKRIVSWSCNHSSIGFRVLRYALNLNIQVHGCQFFSINHRTFAIPEFFRVQAGHVCICNICYQNSIFLQAKNKAIHPPA